MGKHTWDLCAQHAHTYTRTHIHTRTRAHTHARACVPQRPENYLHTTEVSFATTWQPPQNTPQIPFQKKKELFQNKYGEA